VSNIDPVTLALARGVRVVPFADFDPDDPRNISLSGGLLDAPTWADYVERFAPHAQIAVTMARAWIEAAELVGLHGDEFQDWEFALPHDMRLGFTQRAWGDFMQAIVGRREGYQAYYHRWTSDDPIGALWRGLRDHGKPPLEWALRWLEPHGAIRAAWAASESGWDMRAVLAHAGRTEPATVTSAHGVAVPWPLANAALVRRAFPEPPTLDELMRRKPFTLAIV
jgi:hypothetical protein